MKIKPNDGEIPWPGTEKKRASKFVVPMRHRARVKNDIEGMR